jgi:hypothetical protein
MTRRKKVKKSDIGAVSPQVAAHLEKSAAKADGGPRAVGKTMGGGVINPKVAAHTARKQVGGGVIHPKVANHIN